jgi:hypothetical protein
VRGLGERAGLPPARVANRVIFDKLVQLLVFGCGYRKIADQAARPRPSAIVTEARGSRWARGRRRRQPPRRAPTGPTLATLDRLGPLPTSRRCTWTAAMTVARPRGPRRARHDRPDRRRGQACSDPGQPTVASGPDHAWGNQFKKLVWNTERRDLVIDAFFALAHTIIITLRRLIRRAWTLYRWDTRPSPTSLNPLSAQTVSSSQARAAALPPPTGPPRRWYASGLG